MRIPRLAGLAAAAIALGAIASPAAAQPVIDDFESGTFHLPGTAGAYVSTCVPVSSPAHAMSSPREVALKSNIAGGLPADAMLNSWSALDDKMRVTFPPGGGTAYLNYSTPGSPVDLTAGGLNDRIEADFSASTVGGTFLAFFYDTMTGLGTFSTSVPPNTVVIPFAGLTGAVDLTDVRLVKFAFRNEDASAYDLRDIRAMRKEGILLGFDIPTETIVGPPYPTGPLTFNVTDDMPSDLQKIRLLNATKTATGGAAGIALTGMDSGGDMGPGFAGAVTASWNEAGRPFSSTAFDMKVDVSAVSGVEPQPFLPTLPVITSTPTGFLLAFDVHFPSDTGEIVRTSRRQMPFDAPPGQGLRFEDVLIPPGASTGTTGFRVTFTAVDTGDVDTGEPLFEAMLTGDCQPASAVTGVPAVDGGVGGRVFWAEPSVTRAGVDLLLARPSEAAGRIDLFDVAGRLQRSLEVTQGSRGRSWDGRDAEGHPIASGLYFARFTNGKRDLRTRIVCIR